MVDAKGIHSTITFGRVRQLLDYDHEAGVLRWAVSGGGRRKDGSAGHLKKETGYIYLCIDYQKVLAHRVIWLWMTGEWPKGQIDHIDGNTTNNRWSNLRDVTPNQNHWNSKLPSNNTSGCKGVRLNVYGKFTANIKVGGKRIYLGQAFTTMEDAIAARRTAEAKYHGEFARTNP